MNISIQLGLWVLPLVATIGAFVWAWWWCSTEKVQRGGWFSFPFYPVVAVPAATIFSLVSWLAWSLLT